MIQNGNILDIADIYGDIIDSGMCTHTCTHNTHNHIGGYCIGVLDCLENLQKEEMNIKAVLNCMAFNLFMKGK